MRPPVFVHPLSAEELIALETGYRQTHDADERTPVKSSYCLIGG